MICYKGRRTSLRLLHPGDASTRHQYGVSVTNKTRLAHTASIDSKTLWASTDAFPVDLFIACV